MAEPIHRLAFILHDNRSGSTFLSALLSKYQSFGVMPENDYVRWILAYPEQVIRSGEALVDYLYARSRLPELGLGRDLIVEALAEQHRVLQKRDVIRIIATRYFAGRVPEAQCFVMKGPGMYTALEALRDAVPDVYVIHLIRDGRAVFNSKRQTPSIKYRRGGYERQGMMETNPFRAARIWKRKIKMVDRYQGAAYEIRYEDLVRDPQGTVSGLVDALGMKPEDLIAVRDQEDYLRRIPQAYHRVHEHVTKSAQEDFSVKWKRELEDAAIYAYERAAQKYLVRMGYPLSELEKARSLRERLTMEAALLKFRLEQLALDMAGGLWRTKRYLFHFLPVKSGPAHPPARLSEVAHGGHGRNTAAGNES